MGEKAPPPKRKGVRRSRRVVPRVVFSSSTRGGGYQGHRSGHGHRGVTLRNLVVAQLKLTARLSAIRLVALKRSDNTWADQADAVMVRGAVMRFTRFTSLTELPASSDMIHVRVEVASKLPSESADENNILAEEAVGIVNENVGRKRKAIGQAVAFSSCDLTMADDLHKHMSTEAYFQVEEEVPPEAIKEIEHEYLKNVKARGLPRHLSEEDRRPFIESIWQTCISTAKDKMEREISDPKKLKDNKLLLRAECPINDVNLAAIAHWVIKKGERIVIVTEAKRCGVTQTQYQNIAAMEAARCVYKMANDSWSSIKGICTDLQSWVFVSQHNKSVCLDATSVGISRTH